MVTEYECVVWYDGVGEQAVVYHTHTYVHMHAMWCSWLCCDYHRYYSSVDVVQRGIGAVREMHNSERCTTACDVRERGRW